MHHSFANLNPKPKILSFQKAQNPKERKNVLGIACYGILPYKGLSTKELRKR
jgi:hypothetical protein